MLCWRHIWCTFPAQVTLRRRAGWPSRRCEVTDRIARDGRHAKHEGIAISQQPIRARHFQVTLSHAAFHTRKRPPGGGGGAKAMWKVNICSGFLGQLGVLCARTCQPSATAEKRFSNWDWKLRRGVDRAVTVRAQKRTLTWLCWLRCCFTVNNTTAQLAPVMKCDFVFLLFICCYSLLQIHNSFGTFVG